MHRVLPELRATPRYSRSPLPHWQMVAADFAVTTEVTVYWLPSHDGAIGAAPAVDVPTESAPAARTREAPAVARRPLPPVEIFSAMVDRPLFAATRHPRVSPEEPALEPFPEEVAEAPPAPDDIRDRYRLIGTVDEDGRVFALLVSNDGAYVRVRRGDRLENWTVDAISRQRVLMVNGDEGAELRLVPQGMN